VLENSIYINLLLFEIHGRTSASSKSFIEVGMTPFDPVQRKEWEMSKTASVGKARVFLSPL
jgi:hypothetical protein